MRIIAINHMTTKLEQIKEADDCISFSLCHFIWKYGIDCLNYLFKIYNFLIYKIHTICCSWAYKNGMGWAQYNKLY